MELTKNIGETDRKIRFAAGALIILWGLFDSNWLGLVGLVLIATAYVRSCPAYSLMTMSTVEKE